jgi:hypothetical protein
MLEHELELAHHRPGDDVLEGRALVPGREQPAALLARISAMARKY